MGSSEVAAEEGGAPAQRFAPLQGCTFAEEVPKMRLMEEEPGTRSL